MTTATAEKLESTPKEGTLRVWHIPNPPRKPFHVEVGSLEEAALVLNLIADYDNYLGDPVIEANVQGIEMYHDGEWMEWYGDDPEGEEVEFEDIRESRYEAARKLLAQPRQ